MCPLNFNLWFQPIIIWLCFWIISSAPDRLTGCTYRYTQLSFVVSLLNEVLCPTSPSPKTKVILWLERILYYIILKEPRFHIFGIMKLFWKFLFIFTLNTFFLWIDLIVDMFLFCFSFRITWLWFQYAIICPIRTKLNQFKM